MTLSQYIAALDQRYRAGDATEHTYRGDLQTLIESIVPEVRATNEPKRQACGAPDYILSKKGIDVGFIEAKNIGDTDLLGKKKKGGNKEQFDRYKASLNNLIFTDYLRFHVYSEGELQTQITIGELSDGGIRAIPENFPAFENLLRDFCTQVSQTINSPQKLAAMMAGKARLLADIIGKSLRYDIRNEARSTLQDQFEAFQNILIQGIKPEGFADVYAQTIAYGMFAARSHDAALETFTRQEAAVLIPKSNPFLRKLFQYIAGYDLDDRIRWVVDDLVQIFLACDVREILKDYGKATQTEDPIVHFYETFLAEYKPDVRIERGVWYTPQPVVNFMVRAVDEVLKTEFGLPDGLADTSKTKVKVDNKGKVAEAETHKVQILDPATGTGTFLAEIIKHIYSQQFRGMEGAWSAYVERDLIPRLSGFELLMASYAMAHLQLELVLADTGYRPTEESRSDQRFKVYLTNSLQEPSTKLETQFARWLSAEANEANQIKRDTPVMCIIGNPPYRGESQNKSRWIMDLMKDYKKEPGGKKKLQERNPKWLNDDYVKFMRYGQHFIEKNGSGVLAFINPHGFMDNPTFRGMRWNLLKTYDKIYTIDLHGNSKKKEVSPDGSPDSNVFDIQQGVSINIFIKTGKKKVGELGKVFHFDLYGKRNVKYDFLRKHSLQNVPFTALPNKAPMYFMVQKDFEAQEEYRKGFSVQELFTVNSVGIVTARDSFTIHDTINEAKDTIEKFMSMEDEDARTYFKLGKDVRDWKVSYAKKDLKENYPSKGTFAKLSYRPFDEKWTFFTGNSKGFHCYPREEVMKHFLNQPNIGLVIARQCASDWRYVFISKSIGEFNLTGTAGRYGSGNYFPLYIYPNIQAEKAYHQAIESLKMRYEESQIIAENFKETFNQIQKVYAKTNRPSEELKKYYTQQKRHYTRLQNTVKKHEQELNDKQSQPLFQEDVNERVPNLDKEIVAKIAQKLGLRFTVEKEDDPDTFAPIDLLDYIYAVLHAPAYRETYQEFLKIDFPRVPYPDKETFWELVKLGGELRQIHLLESPKVEEYITSYPESGSNEITRGINKKDWELTGEKLGRVWINDTQYFENVPLLAWEFYIGGYQPAQKWLKDRRGHTLNLDDIRHYQKIIVALTETHRLMQEIDTVLVI